MSADLDFDLAAALDVVLADARTSGFRAKARGDAIEMIVRDELIRPAAAFQIVKTEAMLGDRYDLGGISLRAPALGGEPGKVFAVAACACTLGPQLEAKVSELFRARRALLAVTLDQLGNELLFGIAARLQEQVHLEAQRRALEPGFERYPGDPGIDLAEQAAVLMLAGAHNAGISVSAGGSLRPAKSLSCVVVLGRGLRSRVRSERCDPCPSKNRCRKARDRATPFPLE